MPASSLLLAQPQESKHEAGDTLPVLCFLMKPFPACLGDGIELGSAIIRGSTPLRGDPTPLQQTQQRRINRSLVEFESAFTDLFNAARQTIPVQWPHGVKSLEHHQVQRALKDVRSAR